MDDSRLIYLACPYTHPLAEVRAERAAEADRALAWLCRQGVVGVYSPISHTHHCAVAHDLPGDWKFWAANCQVFLAHSKQLLLLTIPGWSTSVGCRAEVATAQMLGISCERLTPLANGEYMRTPLVRRHMEESHAG